jgi:hypothetical protein
VNRASLRSARTLLDSFLLDKSTYSVLLREGLEAEIGDAVRDLTVKEYESVADSHEGF